MKYILICISIVLGSCIISQHQKINIKDLDSTNLKEFMTSERNAVKKITKKFKHQNSEQIVNCLGAPSGSNQKDNQTIIYYRLKTTETASTINTSTLQLYFDYENQFIQANRTSRSARKL